QPDALADAGVERAVARLLADPATAKDETVELIPDSQLHIEIRAVPGKDNIFRVTSEARYPKDGPEFVRRSLSRSVKRVTRDNQIRIEILPAAPAVPKASAPEENLQ